MGTVTIYSRDGRRIRETSIWKWRLSVPFALWVPAVLFTGWQALFGPNWGYYIIPFALSIGAMVAGFFNLGQICLDHNVPSVQKWVWKKTGWTDQISRTRDYDVARVTDIVYDIRSYVKEFPDIDMLRTLAINAEACANSYYTLTDQYKHFLGIDTSGATMSRETIMRDRDKVAAAQRDVYTAANALVNKERAALAEDRAKALEMATGSYTGDVSDLVARAKDEAVLAREYINNRQV